MLNLLMVLNLTGLRQFARVFYTEQVLDRFLSAASNYFLC